MCDEVDDDRADKPPLTESPLDVAAVAVVSSERLRDSTPAVFGMNSARDDRFSTGRLVWCSRGEIFCCCIATGGEDIVSNARASVFENAKQKETNWTNGTNLKDSK